MSYSLQIWSIVHNLVPNKKGVLFSTINFWAQDGVQYFTFIATSDAVKENFQDNDNFTVETLTKGTLVPVGTPWTKPANKAKRTKATSGFSNSDRQMIMFSGVKNHTEGTAPVGLSTL